MWLSYGKSVGGRSVDPNSVCRRARIKFQDPDGLPIDFSTPDYLKGAIIMTVPGPDEVNWVLQLDKPLRCRDTHHQWYEGRHFLLKPNGLDSEQLMRHSPDRLGGDQKVAVMALLILQIDKLPATITQPEEYRQYPLISAGSDLILE